MNPSSEVGKASGEETGIEEMMEDVVTTVEAMMLVVEAVEAMVMAVEMWELLEVGRPETERNTAIHFFSCALAVQKRKDMKYTVHHISRPLYWPGLLPGLVQLLADCLLPHNFKAIQSGAMLSIKYLLLSLCSDGADHRLQVLQEVSSHASDHLVRLVRETDCTEIRDQSVWLLGQTAKYWSIMIHIDATWTKGFLPLLTDLVRKYAATAEPTETEISSLNTAIKALKQVCRMLGNLHYHNNPPFPPPPHSWEPHILEILPVLIGIFKEPGKRKNAQIRAGQFLEAVVRTMDGNFLLENGMIEMLLETVRVGKEPTAILICALHALRGFIDHNNVIVNNGTVYVKRVLDMGALDVLHLVLKRPNDSFNGSTLWTSAIDALPSTIVHPTGENLEAVLSQEGLLELILDLALGTDMSKEKRWYHHVTGSLLFSLTELCSEGQMRGLMFKGRLFRVLSRYLNCEPFGAVCPMLALWVVRSCLARSSLADRRTIRLLLDDTGITDDIRRISLAVPQTQSQLWEKERACHILDTYLNHPLPPLPPHNLPSIIYTRNAPS